MYVGHKTVSVVFNTPGSEINGVCFIQGIRRHTPFQPSLTAPLPRIPLLRFRIFFLLFFFPALYCVAVIYARPLLVPANG